MLKTKYFLDNMYYETFFIRYTPDVLKKLNNMLFNSAKIDIQWSKCNKNILKTLIICSTIKSLENLTGRSPQIKLHRLKIQHSKKPICKLNISICQLTWDVMKILFYFITHKRRLHTKIFTYISISPNKYIIYIKHLKNLIKGIRIQWNLNELPIDISSSFTDSFILSFFKKNKKYNKKIKNIY